ncbi:hypothetical protein BS50DRAFT_614797 [Corynespora cassiicola Philippines]|uniref:Rhodopsin domain-containing protein n=1 Tax=Corynespora cassiicola Philippines TaxID=1448308 RepID=A0A2T2MZS4_CORCC|nr:hypothetical protein BS50DRAFT_614797 [Corynespora cassiicola Philippines]
MKFFPDEVILSWPTPNYVNRVTRGHALVYVNSVLIAIAIVVSILRLYTRLVIKPLILDVGNTACVWLANQRYGWDRHIYDIPFDKWAPTAKAAFTAKILFLLAVSATRLSLFSLYYRLSSGISSRSYRWLLHANVAGTVAFVVCFTTLTVLICIPVSNYWKITSDPDTCVNEGVAVVAAGSRLALVLLFSLGLIVTGAGIVQCYYSYKSLIAEYDVTWYAYPLWITSAVEIHLGIICASAPPLRPFLAKIPFRLPIWLSKLSTQSSKVTNSTAQPEATAPENAEDRADTAEEGRVKSTYRNQEVPPKRLQACNLVGYDLEEGIAMQSIRPQTPELGPWDHVERCSRARSQTMDSQEAILGSDDGAREIEGVDRCSRLKMHIVSTSVSPRAHPTV